MSKKTRKTQKKLGCALGCALAVTLTLCLYSTSPACALFEESGNCLNKGCIEDQMKRVGKILQELRQHSGIHAFGYVAYITIGEGRFIVQSGVLNKRTEGAAVLWKFRDQQAGGRIPTFLVFDSNMRPVGQ